MKIWAMKQEVENAGIFYPVYFDKKKFLKAMSYLKHSHDWKTYLKEEADTYLKEEIIDFFIEHDYKFKKGSTTLC